MTEVHDELTIAQALILTRLCGRDNEKVLGQGDRRELVENQQVLIEWMERRLLPRNPFAEPDARVGGLKPGP